MHNLNIKKKIENAKMQIGVASDLVFSPNRPLRSHLQMDHSPAQCLM